MKYTLMHKNIKVLDFEIDDGGYIEKIYDSYDSYQEIFDILLADRHITKQKFENIVANNYFLYSVHLSNFGWTSFSFDGNRSGMLNSSNTIEAFVLKASIALKYKCYYDDTGWTDFYSNDHICGSVANRKKIQGLCISSDSDTNVQFEYRLYNLRSGWSKFVKKGTELISLDGFSGCVNQTL